MTAWLQADWLGQPRWRWLAFGAVLVALAAVWGWAACVAVPPWLLALRPSRVPQPADVHDADEASGRAVTVSRQADARDAELRQREAQVRDRVRDMSDDELARELERTRRPR